MELLKTSTCIEDYFASSTVCTYEYQVSTSSDSLITVMANLEQSISGYGLAFIWIAVFILAFFTFLQFVRK
jgi:hypothetical protein